MSDPDESDSYDQRRYPLDQYQEPQISVEVEDDMSSAEAELEVDNTNEADNNDGGGMVVKVTNIIDGLFQFASRASSRSSIDGSEPDSGRSSPSNTSSNPSRRIRPHVKANNSSSSGSFRRRRPSTAGTKKVQFKEQGQHQLSTGGTPLLSSAQQRDSSSTFASRRRLSNDSQRSSNSNLDGSTSSINSWEVTVAPVTGSSAVTDLHTRNSLSPTAAEALRPTMKQLQFGETPQSRAAATAPRQRPQLVNGPDLNKRTQLGKSPMDATKTIAVSADQPKILWFEKYMPSGVNRIREICGIIVTNDGFQLLMVLLICTNALLMGLGTFDFISDNDQLRHIFEIVDDVFLVIFTIELALSFGYWGYQLFFDGWLVFDFVTIISSWILDGAQIFRSFRIFRAFRLIVRIPILRSLVYAVIHVLPRISSIMALFSLIIYIFAVMCTTLYKDYFKEGHTDIDYFGRLDTSLFTLFQFVTLEGWGEVVRQVAAVDFYANFIFLTFISVSAFILYSLIVAVICDSFLIVEGQIRAEMKEQARLERERRRALKRMKKKAKRDIFAEESSNFDLDMNDDEDDEPTSHVKNSLVGNLHPDVTGAVPGQRPWGNPSLEKATPAPSSSSSPGRSRPALKSPDRVEKPTTQRSHSPARSFSPAPRTPPRSLKPPAGPAGGEKKEMQGNIDDEEDRSILDPMKFTETTSATATTLTQTLASGGLERKKRSTRKKTRPPIQRIARIQKKLDKMAETQTNILATLDDLCSQMDDEA